jgi:hypothetical protein
LLLLLLLWLLLLAHLLRARLAWWAGIMETEILHARFDVVEVEGKIWCCGYAMNRAMVVVSADFRSDGGHRLNHGDLNEGVQMVFSRVKERPFVHTHQQLPALLALT